jgi:hypothetical protein
MTKRFTLSTTVRQRLPPRRANTLEVFAGVLPRKTASGCVTLWRAGQPTQSEGRVASLINSPHRKRRGGRVVLRTPLDVLRLSPHHIESIGYPIFPNAPVRNLHHI